MDDRLRQELSAWFQFYSEIGLDPFYRRSPGDLTLPRLMSEQDGVTGAMIIGPAIAAGWQETQAPAPRAAARQGSSSISFGPSGTQTGSPLPGMVPRTPAHALNLFEAP